MRRIKRNIIVLLTLAVIMAPLTVQPVSAQNRIHEPTGPGMTADLLVVRPLSMVGTAIGCVVYAIALPFTVWSKERLQVAGENLVIVPGEYTFVRPLGEF